jgi:hypothetical protein
VAFYKVVWKRSAKKELKKLPKDIILKMGSLRYCTIPYISWVMRMEVLNGLQDVVAGTAKWRPNILNIISTVESQKMNLVLSG